MPKRPIELRSNPVAFLTLSVFLTAAVLLWLGWQTYASYHVVRELTQRNLKIEELRGVIIHLDELLTMSARMAAVTGRIWWEQRYRRYEPLLDAAIKEVMTLSPIAARYAGAAQTNDAHVKLVGLEHRTFDLVHENRLEEARSVIFGPDYEAQKRVYADGMTQMDAQLKKTQQALFDSSRHQAVLNILMVGGVLMVLAIGWAALLRMIRRWHTMLLEQHHRLTEQSDSFARLNQTLDQNVLERTEQLSREIAERKLAEQGLRKAHAQTEVLLSSITSILIGVTADGRITYWNSVDEALFGLAEPDILNRPLADCGVRWDTARLSEGIAACLAQTSPFQIDDVAFQYPSGQHGVLGFTFIPIRGSLERRIEVLIFGADVTEQRRLEQELSQTIEAADHQNRELKQREKVTQSLLEDLETSKRRVEKDQQELLRMNRRLTELSAIKDEFVATVSHELRTPLTAIKEGISLLLDQALGAINEEQRDFLTTVDESIDRLTELVTNMLDLSKIEAGRMRLLRKRLDMRRLVETALQNYQALADTRIITTQLADVPPVLADANRVIQVLNNLLSNAVKFTTEQGAIAITLGASDGMVAVSVKDDGAGMASEDLPKLFQKFSQVGEGQNKPRGTGLGLALCKELVELHKGTITATAEPGRGSTFCFTMPVYTPQLALAVNLEELVDQAKRAQQETIALMILDCEPLSGRLQGVQAEEPFERLEQIAELVRRHLHRGDVVVSVEPRWVVILAITDGMGIDAMAQRLRAALAERAGLDEGEAARLPFHLGSALYPPDGLDAPTLFAKAVASLSDGVTSTRKTAPVRGSGP